MKRDFDLSSSSSSSDCIYDNLLWKFVDENYEFLINDDFLEHCKVIISCSFGFFSTPPAMKSRPQQLIPLLNLALFYWRI